jgi:GTP1/Obg family GTP-binding protein
MSSRRYHATDAVLAKRLARVEILLDLHSAEIRPEVLRSIHGRIASVRTELERRAATLERVRDRLRKQERADTTT